MMGGGHEEEEGEEAREPAKKKLQVDTFSCSLIANSSLTSPDAKTVDATFLQYQNQRLVQQLEAKKIEVHALEEKYKELGEKHESYNEILISVNRMWNRLIDDIVLFQLLLIGDPDVLQELDKLGHARDKIPECKPDDMFLCRLLDSYPICGAENNLSLMHIQRALDLRCASTLNLLKHLKDSLDAQMATTEDMIRSLRENTSVEDTLQKLDTSLEQEIDNLHNTIDFLKEKHSNFENDIRLHLENHHKDQSDIKRLSNELGESLAELEEARRKLINLKMQRGGISRAHSPVFNVVNGSGSPDKPAERSMSLKKLKSSLEEAKLLAESRFHELRDAQEDVSILSRHLDDLEDSLKDEKYVISSKPYLIMDDQLKHLKAELERYKELVESLQTDRNYLLRKEKELALKSESADVATNALSTAEAKLGDLQIQFQRCTVERDDIEIKLEEALQDAGRKDIKDEIHVMASALSKEMEMMETQLKRCKETALEVTSLREEACSLEASLESKISDHQRLLSKCAEQAMEIKSLKTLIEKMETEKKELTIFLDMYGQECYDKRSILEIEESEHRANLQAEALKAALDEHSLELRVKAAKEAEVACEQRLLAAESEIADLRGRFDASERDTLTLTEAISVKDVEAEAYISEIEAIGQAYDDMLKQNQRLSQQLADRDDYNIKLVSDSVKMKQSHGTLLSEKQVALKQLQQVTASLEYLKNKITRGEDQLKGLLVQAMKTSSENRHLIISIDRAKLELSGDEKELKWLNSAVESYEKEYKQNQQNIADMKAELEIERNERKRLEEELVEVKAEVDEMSVENQAAAAQKLQDEIKECKAILKCGVCFDRPKEVVITKCFHLFCSPCIQRNLEIRHRKCPGCGTPFGQNDVREVNI